MKWVIPLRNMRPADEEGDADSGDGWDEDGEEARQNEQDAEGDGPVDGFAGDGAERGGCSAHEVQSSERCRCKVPGDAGES